jgi:hypothetical protein
MFQHQPKESNGYSPQVYEAEKESGVRRDSGAKKLKRLLPWHVQMLKLHLQGFSNRVIAARLRKGENTISLCLSDPKIQVLRSKALEGLVHEFDVLEAKAIDAIRSGLDSTSVDQKLKAATAWSKEKERRDKVHGQVNEGAEDVVARLFSRIENLTINHTTNVLNVDKS